MPVIIPGDRPRLREQSVDASGNIGSRDISPTGKRVVLDARGDVWTLPAKKGTPLNLTRTDGSAEREPAWSPDGRWIAYFSDASGEYQLCVAESNGAGETRQLTQFEPGHFLYHPTWSPDSKSIAFWDQTGGLFLADVEKGTTRLVDKLAGSDPTPVSWSSDSNWLAWSRPVKSLLGRSAIWLFDISKGEVAPGDERHVRRLLARVRPRGQVPATSRARASTRTRSTATRARRGSTRRPSGSAPCRSRTTRPRLFRRRSTKRRGATTRRRTRARTRPRRKTRRTTARTRRSPSR